jgi:pimeloyl-ACP methyl ester carboxylesterase
MNRGARSSEPLCQLLRFEATDGVTLSGLLYDGRLARRRSSGEAPALQRAIIWLHGSGGASIFDSNRTNLLARTFVDRGFAFFPFNNRGAHLVRTLRSRTKRIDAGMAHELIRDCVPDIDGAIRELRRRGVRDITLAGHSTGANKIAVYDSRKPRNRVQRYIFLAGGDDTGLMFAPLGPRRFASALVKARAMIHAHRGHEIVPQTISPMMMSWRSFYDMANPNGDYNVFPFLEATTGPRLSKRPLFRHIRAIRKPSLYVLGDRDEYCSDVAAAAGTLAANAGANAEIVVMRDADHGFSGREGELATLMADWIEMGK